MQKETKLIGERGLPIQYAKSDDIYGHLLNQKWITNHRIDNFPKKLLLHYCNLWLKASKLARLPEVKVIILLIYVFRFENKHITVEVTLPSASHGNS